VRNFFDTAFQLFIQLSFFRQFTANLGFLIPGTFFGLGYLFILVDDNLLMFCFEFQKFFLGLEDLVLFYSLSFLVSILNKT